MRPTPSASTSRKRKPPAFPTTSQAAREAAQKDGKQGWKFTLHMPSYLPVMQYADNRALREKMYYASSTRASEFGKPEWDNAPLIARIVPLRREMAQLLGYANFAELARAQDGRVAGAGARLSRRPRAPRSGLRRKGRRRAA